MGAAPECGQISLLGGNSLRSFCSLLFMSEPHRKAGTSSAVQMG